MKRNLHATHLVALAIAFAAALVTTPAVNALGNSMLEIGIVVPGTPTDLASDLIHIQDLITLYNTSPADGSTVTLPTGPGGSLEVYTIHPGSSIPPPVLPTPISGLGPFTAGSGGSTLTLTLVGPTIYDYITVKWGNDTEGYYINGLSSFTLPNDVNQNGWSGFELWDPHTRQVLDSGSTIGLLALALAGLFGASRIRALWLA